MTPAAVLVALFEGEGNDVRVWLLRRPEALRTHAGQVALPGGADLVPVLVLLGKDETVKRLRGFATIIGG